MPASYTGSGFEEETGKLVLDSDDGFIPDDSTASIQYHRLNSNTVDGDGLGFELDDQFAATAVFDLDNTADAFGLRLNDPGDGSNNVRLQVRTFEDGTQGIRLNTLDASGETKVFTTHAFQPVTFAVEATQISLTLSHEANTGEASALWDVLASDGTVIESGSFAETAPIFVGEGSVRVQIDAYEVGDSFVEDTFPVRVDLDDADVGSTITLSIDDVVASTLTVTQEDLTQGYIDATLSSASHQYNLE